MGYFKIKNVTNELGKRHGRFNTTQKIDFKDIIYSNSIDIPAGGEITIETVYLPVSAQKLRTEGLITIVEIDKNTYQKMLNTQEAKKQEVKISNNQSQTESIESEDKTKKFKQKSK